jgi:hypothetical protein
MVSIAIEIIPLIIPIFKCISHEIIFFLLSKKKKKKRMSQESEIIRAETAKPDEEVYTIEQLVKILESRIIILESQVKELTKPSKFDKDTERIMDIVYQILLQEELIQDDLEAEIASLDYSE